MLCTVSSGKRSSPSLRFPNVPIGGLLSALTPERRHRCDGGIGSDVWCSRARGRRRTTLASPRSGRIIGASRHRRRHPRAVRRWVPSPKLCGPGRPPDTLCQWLLLAAGSGDQGEVLLGRVGGGGAGHPRLGFAAAALGGAPPRRRRPPARGVHGHGGAGLLASAGVPAGR